MRDVWTEAEIIVLKQRWAKGQSIYEIATVLTRTRDSVKGKLRRLHLPGNQRHPRVNVVMR